MSSRVNGLLLTTGVQIPYQHFLATSQATVEELLSFYTKMTSAQKKKRFSVCFSEFKSIVRIVVYISSMRRK
jgi:hypothetical protein